MKTLYEILEVSENASDEIIEKAYKVLAKKYHPDLQTPENKIKAEVKMKEINEAYEILGNPDKRKKYDDEIEQKRAEEKQQEYNVKENPYQNANIYQDNVNMREETQSNMQDAYRQMDEMRRRQYEEEMRIHEEQIRRKMEADLEQEYQNAYYDYLRSLGFRIKEKWTWKKTKELMAIIAIFIIILVILWFFPPTHNMMVDFYENNPIIRVIVNIIIGIVKGIFQAIANIFSGGK